MLSYEILSDDGGEFGCGEDCEPDDQCFAAVTASEASNTVDFFLSALLEQSLDFRRENLRSNLHWL